MSAPSGRMVALYRTTTVISNMHKWGARTFDVAPPSASMSNGWTTISGRFPGWRITDPSAIEARVGTAEPRMSRYVWIALLAIGIVVAAAGIAAQSLWRQWQLTMVIAR